MDIIGTYLESTFDQDDHLIYMKIPQSCKIGRDHLFCKILKSLYRPKQAETLWNQILIRFFWKISFVPTNADPCIFIH